MAYPATQLRQSSSTTTFTSADARLSAKANALRECKNNIFPFPTLDIIPRRGCACQEKTYAGLWKDLRRFAYNFADLTTFHAKRGDFASRPLEFASVD